MTRMECRSLNLTRAETGDSPRSKPPLSRDQGRWCHVSRWEDMHHWGSELCSQMPGFKSMLLLLGSSGFNVSMLRSPHLRNCDKNICLRWQMWKINRPILIKCLAQGLGYGGIRSTLTICVTLNKGKGHGEPGPRTILPHLTQQDFPSVRFWDTCFFSVVISSKFLKLQGLGGLSSRAAAIRSLKKAMCFLPLSRKAQDWEGGEYFKEEPLLLQRPQYNSRNDPVPPNIWFKRQI